jgi:hypothetical protein
MRSQPTQLALIMLVAMPITSISTSARAQDDELPPGSTMGSSSPGSASQSRPLYFGAGLGISASLDNGPALFKLQEEIGYQFDPIELVPGGADLVMRVGGDFAQQFGDYTILQFGARFTASFGIWRSDDIVIRIAPSIALGGALLILPQFCGGSVCVGGDLGAFDFQFATQGEVEMLEGFLTIWFRPIAIDAFFRDGSSSRWDVLAGVDFHL